MPHVRVLPILPAKKDECKAFIAELLTTRAEKFGESQRAEGITEEHFFIQSDPKGDYLIVYNDGEPIKREWIRQVRATTDDPFDIWYRERFREIHGIDLTRPPEGGSNVEHIGSWSKS